MSIKLGLQRIHQLIEHSPNPKLLSSLNVLHVGGTNGKGSICSYLQSILMNASKNNDSGLVEQSVHYKVGKYCSPHLIHPSDSITINSNPITMQNYEKYMSVLNDINSRHGIQASNFELLTCVAFQWFYDNKVDFAIIEVGVGGENDATNIIPGESKLVVNLNKISLDHTNLLGSTLEEIATEKSGIIKRNVGKVFINGNNTNIVKTILTNKCKSENVPYQIVNVEDVDPKLLQNAPGYQKENLAMALSNIQYLHKETTHLPRLTETDILKGMTTMEWPGRLQRLDYQYTKDKNTPVLLDGAHNEDGAKQLGDYLDNHCRKGPSTSLTFVLAMTEGKDVSGILKNVLRPKDVVVITQFDSVTDMPWIKTMSAEKLYSNVAQCVLDKNILIENNLKSTIPIALFNKINADQPLVVFGSLYLVGQMLNLHQKNVMKVTSH
ncbi:hypothetical protein ACO0RG_001820 [Hanseniaspora osmophila]|uniref:Dihydrofolate synthetase n=1 Tax=Hanseniaspora osmophila TaxID=56408 RepID=A0A1E5RIE9_9ASCO|nr:Dihydrofolate synthetase [Hanseniaspora osmophila]